MTDIALSQAVAAGRRPPIPTWKEAERLAALDRYEILDTGRETAFDDVAILAADLLDAPIAVVNLIAADRQWFKAEVGIGADTLPLDVSICRHAILRPGVFVVPDLAKDARFEGNPLVHVADGLRFYAGALLETPDGLPLGTLCVLDTKARPGGLSERQERALKVLAAQTMAQLELRRSEAIARVERARAEDHARRLSLLSEASSLLLGTFDPARTSHALFSLVADRIRIDFAFHYRCEGGALHLVAAAGLTPEQELAAARIEFGETVCGIVAATREAAYITGIKASDDPHVQIARMLGVESYFSLPLLSGDDLLGTLAFGRKDGPFSPGELEALGTLAGQLATALERRQVEEALRALNLDLERQVIERSQARGRSWAVSPDLMGALNAEGFFETSNPAWRTMLGWSEEEVRRTPIWDLLHPDDLQQTQKGFALTQIGEPAFQVANRYRCKDGSYRWISWIGVPEDELVYCTGRDITAERDREAELAQAQEALRQSQKMEAMGQLTGGVAHDFNNLLTPIVGALDMLQRRGVGGEREQRLIAGAVQSAERAKVLVQRLLSFARRQPLQPTAVDVGRLVAEMADLVSSTTGPQIKVAVEIPHDLPPAAADSNQLEMALLNLSVNARDAMPEGGALRISAISEVVRTAQEPGLKAGAYVKLSVADTGLGMDEATLARAVEPFFSTKGIGKGTGLGLSMVHGLASQLGGALRIHSRPGLGTNIELWLPQSSVAFSPPQDAPPISRTPAARGAALLVDDEELVRLSTADMLSDLGYSVIEAGSAEEALRLFDEGLRPDVLVTDHLMPGMSGTELARILTARSGALSVLIVSGYAESEGVAPDLPRLTKPFRNDELAAALAGFVSK